ncbi:MAG: hypothetical protein ACJ77A_01710 [Actinomycetota bacterium]
MSGSEGEAQTWEGVMIYEIGAKLQGTSAEPELIDPDELGGRLRQAIAAALEAFDSRGAVQFSEVRYAGSRGASKYR